MPNWTIGLSPGNHKLMHTAISLFSGLGGMDLGFEWEGFNIIWANDVLDAAIRSYEVNFGRSAVNGDINSISLDDIPSADVIIGGPPCQSFSLVGKRNPKDPRGQLVFRFLEIVREKKPTAFIMENVPGLAASQINGRRLHDYLAEEFASVGYEVTVCKLLATEYLVPQRRQRLFILGSQRGRIKPPSSAVYARSTYGVDSNTFSLGAAAAIGDLGDCTAKGARAKYKSIEPSAFAKIMRCDAQVDTSLHEFPRMSQLDRILVSHIPPGGNYRDIPDSLNTTRITKFKRTGGRTTTYGRLHPNQPAYTINTYFRRPNVGCNFHYEEPRLITAREAMRFQSIPDYFDIVYSSNDQRNALIGNAVPPLLARAIAWAVRSNLEANKVESVEIGQLPLDLKHVSAI